MTDPWTEQLSDYLDGELSADQARRLEVHLSTCADCTSVLAGLREVATQAQTLMNAPPPMDLWPGIAARIGERRASSMGAPVTAKRAATRRGLLDWLDRKFTITLPQAAAAAAALAAVAGLGVWLWMSHGSSPALPGSGSAVPARVAPAPDTLPPRKRAVTPESETSGGPPSSERAESAGSGNSASVAGYDRRYDATIAELQRVLAEERSRLDPKTVKVLESNLAIIDRAVADARRAVESDPSNFYLRNHLASVMKRKADLLRQAPLLAQEQGSEG